MSENKSELFKRKKLTFSILDLPIILWVVLPSTLTAVFACAIHIFLKTQVL